MGSWFGSLDLAYKYTLVFGSLLVLTFLAGFIKVFLDRRKRRMKKLSEQKDEESSPREEQMELTHREKDEGDLFGIRAIEAGYFAGIPQSRPTSRAGSIVGGPTMSSSTLVGGFNSPKIQTHSMASSVTSLPLAHTNDRNRDSETLPATLRRTSPPAIKLLPSEAQLSGRINHNAAVNMSLNVPPSPVSSKFGGSDSGESDTHTLRSEHYAPVPAQVPVQNNLRVSVVSVNSPHKSHAASVNDPSPLHSPNRSGPPSPRHRPVSYVPSMPDRAYDDDSRSQPLAYHQPEQPPRRKRL
ncbi:hypothetical protein K458DRAFT_141009 [Lentithecium fluviatile CBS 122367]|uniref:Uncharacterized protein n=1 Tax=Lentithecium fluviatile CBS 122367 TaxID=1168545 RepID=A0A6G1IIQ1_9PLEO|nr:hypothetical protein K458DRAFT_141009 [Lentithecium fluviatile CBS 122367]